MLIPDGLQLIENSDGLTLTDGNLQVRGDLTKMARRIQQENLRRELLVRASRIRGIEGEPLAFDATAGLGEDAMLLGAAGFRVRLFERDPVIAALLRDTIRRALKHPELSEIAGRMEVLGEDSILAMPEMEERPDLVLLDPMFPGRTKSGLVGKKLQLLKRLEQPCEDENALLEAAIAAGPRRIVIKRPLKGPYLAGRKPGFSLTGKSIRYDCIDLARS